MALGLKLSSILFLFFKKTDTPQRHFSKVGKRLWATFACVAFLSGQ